LIQRELRLIEAMTSACRNLLEYHIHSKRPGSLRFSKDEHPTMKTIKKLRFIYLSWNNWNLSNYFLIFFFQLT